MSSSPRVGLKEAAEILGVHYMTVYHYVRTGKLAGERHSATWSVAVDDLVTLRAKQKDPDRGVVRSVRPRQLADRLVAGDEAGAWNLLEGALAAGNAPSAVYGDMLTPAMHLVGAGWERGEITVADEHRASAVATRLVGRMGPYFARRGRSKGTVVLGAAPGDYHALPGAMLADLLRVSGFDPDDLGANTPPSSFVEAAASADRLVAVLVGATLDGHDDSIREVIGALRVAGVRAVILTGGHGVPDEAHARALGADGWTGRDAVTAVETVLARMAAPRRD